MRTRLGLFLLLGSAAWSACDSDRAPLPPAPGVRTIPELERALKCGTPGCRMSAARTLRDRGPAAREVVPVLVEALRDEDPAVVDAVRSALLAIGPAPKSSLLRLRCALRENVAAVRIGAAEALMGIGPHAVEAVPDLIESLADRDGDVRLASLRALVGIGSCAVPTLLEALADHPPGLGRPIIDALGLITPEGRDALASLGDPVLEQILALDR